MSVLGTCPAFWRPFEAALKIEKELGQAGNIVAANLAMNQLMGILVDCAKSVSKVDATPIQSQMDLYFPKSPLRNLKHNDASELIFALFDVTSLFEETAKTAFEFDENVTTGCVTHSRASTKYDLPCSVLKITETHSTLAECLEAYEAAQNMMESLCA